MSIQHIIIHDITNKEDILNSLQAFTDEDWSGNNGEDYTWDEAIENEFDSSQAYVLDLLKKSDLTGNELIETYIDYWLGRCDEASTKIIDCYGYTVVVVYVED